MINKDGAHCDRCADFADADGMKFREIVETIKDEGWHIRKLGNVWLHYCPTCAERLRPDRNQYWWNK